MINSKNNQTVILAFQTVIDNWCTAFITLFKEGTKMLGGAQLSVSDKTAFTWDHLHVEDNNGNNRDGLELAVQELRNYFRLFFLSTVLLMIMFCSRISKNKFNDLTLTLNGSWIWLLLFFSIFFLLLGVLHLWSSCRFGYYI